MVSLREKSKEIKSVSMIPLLLKGDRTTTSKHEHLLVHPWWRWMHQVSQIEDTTHII